MTPDDIDAVRAVRDGQISVRISATYWVEAASPATTPSHWRGRSDLCRLARPHLVDPY